MSSGRRDYAIALSLVGVLFAIGVPSLARGRVLVGFLCVALGVAVAIWWVFELRRGG